MGTIRFLLPRKDMFKDEALQRAYLAGGEDIPWHGERSWTADELIIRRPNPDVGRLHVPWFTEDQGELTLSTTTLCERDRPYILPVEVARGVLCRLRAQSSTWRHAGLVMPEGFDATLRDATLLLRQAVTNQSREEVAGDYGALCVSLCLTVSEELSGSYAQQVLELRHEGSVPLPTLLGTRIEFDAQSYPQAAAPLKSLLPAANSACVSVKWRDIELDAGQRQWDLSDAQIQWCQEHGIRCCAGPLLKLGEGGIPDWMFLWEDDFFNLQSFVIQFAQAAVNRYRGRVHVWHVAARMNTPTSLQLSEEQELRLIAHVVEAVRSLDARTPIVVSFEQPWAEDLADSPRELSPLHLADALVRAQLGVSGFGLEINYGYWPGGTHSRGMLDVSRQLDRWSQFGLPLVAFLTTPSLSAQDPLAQSAAQPLPHCQPGGVSPDHQSIQARQLLSLLLCKQTVQGVFWNEFSDAQPHGAAHGGLFDAQWQSKPVLDVLASLKSQHLM